MSKHADTDYPKRWSQAVNEVKAEICSEKPWGTLTEEDKAKIVSAAKAKLEEAQKNADSAKSKGQPKYVGMDDEYPFVNPLGVGKGKMLTSAPSKYVPSWKTAKEEKPLLPRNTFQNNAKVPTPWNNFDISFVPPEEGLHYALFNLVKGRIAYLIFLRNVRNAFNYKKIIDWFSKVNFGAGVKSGGFVPATFWADVIQSNHYKTIPLSFHEGMGAGEMSDMLFDAFRAP